MFESDEQIYEIQCFNLHHNKSRTENHRLSFSSRHPKTLKFPVERRKQFSIIVAFREFSNHARTREKSRAKRIKEKIFKFIGLFCLKRHEKFDRSFKYCLDFRAISKHVSMIILCWPYACVSIKCSKHDSTYE